MVVRDKTLPQQEVEVVPLNYSKYSRLILTLDRLEANYLKGSYPTHIK